MSNITQELNQAGKTYVQIGAGAGDQDARADYRDGFSEFVKALPASEIKKIILVEPNPFNMSALSKCWEDFPQASIFELGIVPKSQSGKPLRFFLASQDAPHFQVASINPSHVLKHYRKLTIADLQVVSISTKDLATFIEQTIGNAKIELLCLDIEGIDAEVILDTDLKALNVEFISFEHIHLGQKKDVVISYFERSGYKKIGNGIDHNGFDWLYQKL